MTYWNLGCFIILLKSIQNLYTTKDIVIKSGLIILIKLNRTCAEGHSHGVVEAGGRLWRPFVQPNHQVQDSGQYPDGFSIYVVLETPQPLCAVFQWLTALRGEKVQVSHGFLSQIWAGNSLDCRDCDNAAQVLERPHQSWMWHWHPFSCVFLFPLFNLLFSPDSASQSSYIWWLGLPILSIKTLVIVNFFTKLCISWRRFSIVQEVPGMENPASVSQNEVTVE